MTGAGGNPPAAGDGGAAAPARPWLRLASTGNLEYDRILFFSDAIFAIAITLLVVNMRVPDLPAGMIVATRQLRHALPGMIGFGISFAVIGTFWVGHHTIFRHVRAFDRAMIWLNLVFLGTVAFLPYPTSLLSATSAQTAAVVFYAAWCSVAGVAEAAIWVYACRVPGLLTEDTSRAVRWYYALRMLRAPLVFLLSIPVAIAAPAVAPYTWLTIGVLGIVLRRRMPRDDSSRQREPVG